MTTKRQHTEQPEQLTLLAPADVPLQFRLDRRTRERGLAHIAEASEKFAYLGKAYELTDAMRDMLANGKTYY